MLPTQTPILPTNETMGSMLAFSGVVSDQKYRQFYQPERRYKQTLQGKLACQKGPTQTDWVRTIYIYYIADISGLVPLPKEYVR